MTFCARVTRGRRNHSPGVMACPGVPMGGRVRKWRAVEGHPASVPEEVTSELGGIISSLVQQPQRKAIIRSENEMYDYKTRPSMRAYALTDGSILFPRART